jgi:hypothetical protein
MTSTTTTSLLFFQRAKRKLAALHRRSRFAPSTRLTPRFVSSSGGASSLPLISFSDADIAPLDSIYALQYDIDESGTISHVELFSMLDSLGSTLSKDTIASFFTRFGKTTDDELTIDEVVWCLEDEVKKPKEEKRLVDSLESGMVTPATEGPGGGPSAGDFTEEVNAEPGEYDQADQSSNMKTLAPFVRFSPFTSFPPFCSPFFSSPPQRNRSSH